METRFRAAVIVGCKVSFRFEATSRDGVVAVADEGTLPMQKENNIESEEVWVSKWGILRPGGLMRN